IKPVAASSNPALATVTSDNTGGSRSRKRREEPTPSKLIQAAAGYEQGNVARERLWITSKDLAAGKRQGYKHYSP
ncbi:MAG: hypothetical protein ACO23C_10040, partial [Prochlorococcaceae cyanobacterium]